MLYPIPSNLDFFWKYCLILEVLLQSYACHHHDGELQLALECTENAIKNSTVKLLLPTDEIIDLLNLCLTWTYFQNKVKHYKQLHGTAMGSPVSVFVAEIVMQNVEEQALANNTRTIPLSLHYVDDTFTAVRGPIKMFFSLNLSPTLHLHFQEIQLHSLKVATLDFYTSLHPHPPLLKAFSVL